VEGSFKKCKGEGTGGYPTARGFRKPSPDGGDRQVGLCVTTQRKKQTGKKRGENKRPSLSRPWEMGKEEKRAPRSLAAIKMKGKKVQKRMRKRTANEGKAERRRKKE